MQSLKERYFGLRREGRSAASALMQAKRSLAADAYLRLLGVDLSVVTSWCGTYEVSAFGRRFLVEVRYDDDYYDPLDDYKVVSERAEHSGIGQRGLEELEFVCEVSRRENHRVAVNFTSFDGEFSHLRAHGYSKQVARERVAENLRRWRDEYERQHDDESYAVGVIVSNPELGEESLWGVGLGSDVGDNNEYVRDVAWELIASLTGK